MVSGAEKRNWTTGMANEFVLDAHALIWFLEGNPRLGPNARAAMLELNHVLYLPVIALAEACWVVGRGKTAIPSVADLLADIDADPRIVLIPLDRAILDRSLALPAIKEMHDRQIAATALHLATASSIVPLLTCDPDITSSGLVPVIW
jgi:PIN domain nuclease of toxin-antitoxin system